MGLNAWCSLFHPSSGALPVPGLLPEDAPTAQTGWANNTRGGQGLDSQVALKTERRKKKQQLEARQQQPICSTTTTNAQLAENYQREILNQP